MKPSDLTLLVVLGTADSAPSTLDDILAMAQSLAPHDWAPTSDLVRLCVEGARRAGMLDVASGNGAPANGALQTTVAGHAAISELLRLPIGASCNGAGRACMSAKLCFLHHLPLPERGKIGNELAEFYRDELRQMRPLSCEDGPLGNRSAGFGRRQDAFCLESELAWLDAICRCCARSSRSGGAREVEDPLR